eukprot:11203219-Lingulodinium_polyedra.AAC.1
MWQFKVVLPRGDWECFRDTLMQNYDAKAVEGALRRFNNGRCPKTRIAKLQAIFEGLRWQG